MSDSKYAAPSLGPLLPRRTNEYQRLPEENDRLRSGVADHVVILGHLDFGGMLTTSDVY